MTDLQSHPSTSQAMGRVLAEILAAKRKGLAQAGPADLDQLQTQISKAPPTRDFVAAIAGNACVSAIAEFKRRSPSEGEISGHADPTQVTQAYERAGASAISVLCDPHFQGSLEDLGVVRQAVKLPILCKDFIVERSQLAHARLAGADAALLIVAALTDQELKELHGFGESIGLHLLVEVHTQEELQRALALDAKAIGVNNRDLKTFDVDFERCLKLGQQIPQGCVRVAESGIHEPSQVAALRDAGLCAMLVGTHLMRAPDPGQALHELLQGGRG